MQTGGQGGAQFHRLLSVAGRNTSGRTWAGSGELAVAARNSQVPWVELLELSAMDMARNLVTVHSACQT